MRGQRMSRAVVGLALGAALAALVSVRAANTQRPAPHAFRRPDGQYGNPPTSTTTSTSCPVPRATPGRSRTRWWRPRPQGGRRRPATSAPVRLLHAAPGARGGPERVRLRDRRGGAHAAGPARAAGAGTRAERGPGPRPLRGSLLPRMGLRRGPRRQHLPLLPRPAPATLKRLRQSLKPHGRVVNIDIYHRRPDADRPRPSIIASSTRDLPRKRPSAAGWPWPVSRRFLPYQYFLVLQAK